MLDIDKIRADTPACAELIHFNNAGSSLSPRCVMDVVNAHLQLEQEIGGYEAADQAVEATRATYRDLASLIRCTAKEIALVENSTRAWQLATQALDFSAGDEVVTCDMEYSSNYMGLLHLQRQKGIRIAMVPRDNSGLIDLDKLRSAITAKTRAIFLTHVASHCGDIQPAQAVGELAREKNLFYVLDACQSIGQVDIDVAKIQCDFLTASGRKFLRGPRGTGFLYINWDRCGGLQPPFVDLHSADWTGTDSYRWHDDGRAYEIWEQNVAANLGMGRAAAYALELGMENVQARVSDLASVLHEGLQRLAGVKVQERSTSLSGIVTFCSEKEPALSLSQRLRQAGANTSVAQRIHARLDLDQYDIGDQVRASVHYFNTVAEIERFVELVASGA